jgi:hypothetical protein
LSSGILWFLPSEFIPYDVVALQEQNKANADAFSLRSGNRQRERAGMLSGIVGPTVPHSASA